VGTTTVFFAARYRLFLLIAFLPILGLFYFSNLSELFDPFVGSAIVAEAVEFYRLISLISSVLVVLSSAIGLVLRFRNVNSHT
jgi:hypothetical protein